MMETEPRHENLGQLLERDGELAKIRQALDRARESGETLLIEGPAGIGKTRLLEELAKRAPLDGFRLLRARGSEMERDFGFGVVRQLLGPTLHEMDDERRDRMLSGAAAPAAPVFGLSETLDVHAGEASHYGLFWLLAALAETEPIVLTIDDAHWADSASLRFVRYLARRLDGVSVLVVLAARPSEPGAQAEVLHELKVELDVRTIRPSLLTAAATAAIVGAELGGAVSEPVKVACHEATGGNPFLIDELIADLRPEAEPASLTPEMIGLMGPERIAHSVLSRARGLDPRATDFVRAVAVLGGGSELNVVAALAEIDRERAVAISDGLAAATILVDGARPDFAHPLLRTAVYGDIPAAARAGSHSRAAGVLAEHGAEDEEVAAHLLLCEPGTMPTAPRTLDAAARSAAARGATDSAIAYLQRALEEPTDSGVRGDLLHRLGSAEVTLRDPASIGHLQRALEMIEDPQRATDIVVELAEVLVTAGMWEATVETVDAGLTRFGDTDLPGVLDLEALRAALRGYDPAQAAEYLRELPRLRAIVDGRTDADSSRLRWVLASIGALQSDSRETVIDLIAPTSQEWGIAHRGRESTLASQAGLALLVVDELDAVDAVASALLEDGRTRGSLMAMIAGMGFTAGLSERKGRLDSSAENLSAAVELLQENELSLMALTTFLHFCIDTVVEREDLETIPDLIESLEMPPAFGRTFSGALVHEVRAAVRIGSGDRAGAVASLRETELILRPMQAGPRISAWRSRLARSLPDESREEAITLAEEELAMARVVESPRAEAVSLRTLGLLTGGEEGVTLLRSSVAAAADSPSPLELARSLAELGAALRRGNQRVEARERLREAADLAGQCGAQRLQKRIYDELRVAGARLPQRTASGPDSLTPSEQRVASAAAAGRANREIAQELFVSLRTVEMHLTNAYRKLEISSRSELARALEQVS